MISKNELKYFSSLTQKKYRDIHNKFLVEGEKLIFEAIDSKWECEIIICTKTYFEQNNTTIHSLSQVARRIESISEKEFQKFQTTVSAQGIVGVFHKKAERKLNDICEKLIVVLENINDPGNVGSIMRNADWFGVKEVLLSKNCAELYNSKTIRASAGSIFHLNIITNIILVEAIKALKRKGYRILCADISGNDIFNIKKSDREIIVFSNEANGPTHELLNIADDKVTIPKKGKAESLNVASASAIILSKLTKNY